MSERDKSTFLSQPLMNPNVSSSNSSESHVNQVNVIHTFRSSKKVHNHVGMPPDSTLSAPEATFPYSMIPLSLHIPLLSSRSSHQSPTSTTKESACFEYDPTIDHIHKPKASFKII